MPFLLLMCLSLACLPVEWQPPLAGMRPIHSLAGTAAVTVLLWLSAIYISRRTQYRLQRYPEERIRWLRWYGKRRTWHALAMLAAFLLMLFGCGWGWAVQEFLQSWRGDLPALPGSELLILVPLPLSMLLSWICFYGAERSLLAGDSPKPPFGGRWGYVGFQIRQNLAMTAAPILILILTQGVFRLFPATFHDDRLQLLLIAPFGAAVVVFFPWLMRLMLGLSPLPAGTLRDRLETAARRLNCRCSDILVWNTRQGVANAMVVGVTPWLRYILLSDRLLQEMSHDEIEAVFGHEAGHVRHFHMAYYLVFLTASIAAMSEVTSVARGWVGQAWPEFSAHLEANSARWGSWLALPSFGLLAIYVFGVFGYLSRCCERQADVFGCRAVSCDQPDCQGHTEATALAPGGRMLCAQGIVTFCRALDKVAVLNGISRSRPGWLQSWQHSTIAKRIDFLLRVLDDPALEPRFQRRAFWTKAGVLLATATVLAVAWLWPYVTAGLTALAKK